MRIKAKILTPLIVALAVICAHPVNGASVCKNFSRNLVSQNDTHNNGIVTYLAANGASNYMTIVGVCNGTEGRSTGAADSNPTLPSQTSDYTNCWCRITGPVASSHWVYGKKFSGGETIANNASCFSGCAQYCVQAAAANTYGMADSLLNYLL